MICPKCQSENPDANRFCGMCGSRLQETAPTDPPRPSNGSDAAKVSGTGMRRPFIVSTTAMADVTAQMLHTRVVLPSPQVASATHSGYTTPLRPREIAHGENLPEPEVAPVDPHDEPFFSENSAAPEQLEGTVHEFDLESPEEQEAEEWLEHSVAEHEAHMPPPTEPPSILNLSAPSETAYASERVDERAEATARERNSFLEMDEPTANHDTDVSGPSFLGLGAPAFQQEYLLDEEPRSHAGRNLALVAIVVIVAVLGFLEWRANSRGESTNPADVLHLKMPKKKGQGQVEVLPSAANAPSPATPAPTGNNNGKPDLIAEPNQAAGQNNNTPATSTSTSTSTLAATSESSTGAPANTAAASAATPEKATPQSQPPAKETKAAPVPTQVAKNTPPPAVKPAPLPQSDGGVAKPSATKPTVTKPTPAVENPPAETDPTLNAGGFELQKGKAAGASEEGRMWLWKAVAKGNGEAPVLLADMYLQGKGIAKDCEQAVLLLNAASKKANPRARSKLGSMYATGECVPQDRVQAYKWMTSALAANPGSDWIEKNRQQLLTQMTPAERQRASAMR